MNKLVALTLAAGFALAGGAVAIQAQAQDAPHPPPPGMMDDHGPGPMGPHGPGGPMGGPMRGQMGGPMGGQGFGGPRMGMGRMMHHMREFALIYPAQDRNLSGADVQKIAEGFLLLNGNHTWKVNDVKEESNRVTFALATSDGAPIAHFAMDRHTARPERLD